MKPPPPGWPRMSASVYYQDPIAAIDWLTKAFGFDVRMKIVEESGKLAHSELTFGDAVVMVGGEGGKEPYQEHQKSPRTTGGVTHALAFYLDDVDAHHAQAVAAGATIIRPLRTDDYGAEYWTDRTYGALDPEGHLWWFIQRIK
jgi:uncharacterized glyoxalase superfamily protein PhnB